MSPPKAGRKQARKKTASRKLGPVKDLFLSTSRLVARVEPGLGAIVAAELSSIDPSVRASFSESLNLDEATREGRENENRWDYLLGHASSSKVVALEPHSARDDEVSTVIQKKRAALSHLRDELKTGKSVDRWLWVASGTVRFSRMDKEMRRLDQEGIQFVGNRLLAKHLP